MDGGMCCRRRAYRAGGSSFACVRPIVCVRWTLLPSKWTRLAQRRRYPSLALLKVLPSK